MQKRVKYEMARLLASAGLVVLTAGCGGRRARTDAAVTWSAAAEITDPCAGYGIGVSAMYAAAYGEGAIAAGGANFPGTPAADGGQKAFYDGIYRYRNGAWQRIGTLPCPAAYGVGYTCGDGVVFAGGANTQGAFNDVWLLRPDNKGGLNIDSLPSLPHKIEQAAGAVLDGCLYLFGGLADGQPSATLLSLHTETSATQWQELTPAPEPFVQPIMVASGGFLYLWGGFNPATKQASGSGYRYDIPHDTWTPLPPHPDNGTFTGACAVTLDDGRIACFGGVNRDIFNAALRQPPEKSHEYLSQPVEAYRFQHTLHIFDPATNCWNAPDESERAARAGAAAVKTEEGILLLGGEIKPGIRTNQNSKVTISSCK